MSGECEKRLDLVDDQIVLVVPELQLLPARLGDLAKIQSVSPSLLSQVYGQPACNTSTCELCREVADGLGETVAPSATETENHDEPTG